MNGATTTSNTDFIRVYLDLSFVSMSKVVESSEIISHVKVADFASVRVLEVYNIIHKTFLRLFLSLRRAEAGFKDSHKLTSINLVGLFVIDGGEITHNIS
jgi:hypothetical protein